MLRRLSLELSVKSRGELMQFKEKFVSLTVGKRACGMGDTGFALCSEKCCRPARAAAAKHAKRIMAGKL